MSSKFECKVQINGQTFDIAISDLKSNTALSFGYILPKISEICKIAANEVIEMKRHSFDIFNGKSKWRATRMDQIISHNSIISITPNTFPIDFNLRSDSSVTPKIQKYRPNDGFRRQTKYSSRQTFGKRRITSYEEKSFKIISEQKKLFKEKNSVQLFHQIVMAINIGWNLKGGASNLKWKIIETNVSRSFNAKNCCGNFYYWAGYYAQNYESVDGLLEPFSQNIFNLLKIVHTLNLDQLYNPSNKTALKIKQISQSKHFDRYFQNHLKDIWRQKHNDMNPLLTGKKFIKEYKQKDINNKSYSQKRTIFDSAPKVCTNIQSSVPSKKPSFLSEYRRIKERVKSKKNKSSDNNNNNISLTQNKSISKSVPKGETTYDLKDLVEEMKNDLKSLGEIDIISSNNSFHQKNTTYTSVPKSSNTSKNSFTQSSEKSFEYNRAKDCAKSRTPSTVMVVLPPKKTISLSDYRKKKENTSETVDKSDKNCPNTQTTDYSDPILKITEISQKEKPKESLLNIESNDKKETINRQKTETTIPSDPRLKRKLESNQRLTNIESLPQKKIKSQTNDSITKASESEDKIYKNSSNVLISDRNKTNESQNIEIRGPSDPRLKRRLEMLINQKSNESL